MKLKHHILAVAALLLLPSCTSPWGQNDQFRMAQGQAMMGQVAAQQQASALMAGAARNLRTLAPMHTIPVQPIHTLR